MFPAWSGLTDLPRRWLGCAIAAGVVAGVVYTLSPLSIWTALLAFAIVGAAAHGLPESERRWFFGIVFAALAVRVLAVGVLFAIAPHDDQSAGMLFGDEAYTLQRSWRMRSVILGAPLLKYDYLVAADSYGRSSYLAVATVLQVLFGPAPYALRVLNALVFVGAMLLLFRLTRWAYGPVVAFGGLGLLLCLPTLFFWSISLLKEAPYFALSAAAVSAATACARSRSWGGRLALATAGLLAIWGLRDLRYGAMPLAISGLALGFGAWFVAARWWRIWTVAVLLLVAVLVFVRSPALQAPVLARVDAAATQQAGDVFTVGHAYKLLDEIYYINPMFTRGSLTAAEAGRFVIRAAAAFLLVPLPWRMETKSELAYLPEQLLWYMLVLFACAGMVAAYRRDPLVTCLLLGYIVPTSVAVALSTGNVGTLIRHRTLIVPFLVWVSVIGFCATMGRLLPQQERTR